MGKHKLLNTRYKQLVDYPGCKYKAGDVIDGEIAKEASSDKDVTMAIYPHLFKLLKWYEERLSDFNILFSIKFCRIIKSNGYWREGDILPIEGYKVAADQPVPAFIGFHLKGYGSNPSRDTYSYNQVEPATEAEWMKHKDENKLSISAP